MNAKDIKPTNPFMIMGYFTEEYIFDRKEETERMLPAIRNSCFTIKKNKANQNSPEKVCIPKIGLYFCSNRTRFAYHKNCIRVVFLYLTCQTSRPIQ